MARLQPEKPSNVGRARRNIYGQGSVRERRPGRWEGRYRAADGRVHSVYAKTRADVVLRLRAALVDRDHGIRPISQRVTVGQWLDEWLEISVKGKLRPSTIRSYVGIVETHLKPEFGRVPLARLDAASVQRMLTRLIAENRLSPTTVRYIYTILRIALGRALKLGKVARNVATLIDPPAKARREMRPLTREQVHGFLDAVREDRLGLLYTVAVSTGMRQGELLALRWQDVDFDARTLTVRHTLQPQTRQLGLPKTERSRRTLQLPATALAALIEQRRRQAGEGIASVYVFASEVGTPLDGRNVTHRFQAALQRAGLPRQRFHDLRHAAATLLIEAGEELAVVSRLLGHSDFGTTANIYAHLTSSMERRAADRMDAVLNRTG